MTFSIDLLFFYVYNKIMAQLNSYKINNEFFDNPIDLGGVRLIQAGRYYCEAGTVVPVFPHEDFYELTVVNDGSGIILTNGKRIPVKQNDVYVSFPYDLHGIISSDDAPLQYDHLAFIIDKPEYGDAMREIAIEHNAPEARVISDRRINYLTYLIISEFNKEDFFYNDVVLNSVYNVIIYVIRKFREKNLSSFAEDASESEMFCNRIMSYIDANIYDISNLNELAKIANYNYCYLSQLFRKTTGRTLRDYYLNRRLEAADGLIREGKLKLYQIAEKLHYSNADALGKAYKKKYGVSPKSIKNEKN